MPVTAEMRTMWGETSPLTMMVDHSEPFIVNVPGFGALILARVRPDELGGLLAPPWRALLVQPDPQGEFGPESRQLPRGVAVVDDGRLEIELLPNRSGEDRLVVDVNLGDHA